MPSRKVVLKIELDEEEYKALEAIAKSQGYELPSIMIESLVRAIIKGQTRITQAPTQINSDQLARRLRRTIEDLLNPFTAKIDEINRKIGLLIELLEQKEEQQKPEEPKPQKREQYQRRERYPQRRKSAMDRLKEDGILISSEAPWINEPERFFSSLERRGAIVIKLSDNEYIAVHPEFWEKLVRVLEETAVMDIREVENLLESALGDAAVKLFRILVSEGYIYYDETEANWKVNI